MKAFARLGDCCEIRSGGTPLRTRSDYFGGDIPWAKISDIEASDGQLFATEESISLAGLASIRGRLFPAGTLLFAIYGSIGKMTFAGRELSTNQAILGIQITDPLLLDSRFLYHWLSANQARFLSDGQGIAQKNLSAGYLRNLTISLPPLDEQRRIAAILDQADALRSARRRSLDAVERLRGAYRVELFGDPATNPKGWLIRPVSESIVSVTNGLTRRAASDDHRQDIVLRLRDINAGKVDLSDPARITLSQDEASRFAVERRDLLFVRVNGNPEYVGRCAVFHGANEPIHFNDHIMRVRLNERAMNAVYLQEMLNSEFGRRQIGRYKRTSAGQHTINQEGLSQITIPLPPIEIQRAFEEGLTRILSMRNRMTAEGVKLDALFASLQHRAFTGQLTRADERVVEPA